MERYALIVAGGKGERMQADQPKQFLLLNGRPLLMHTIEAFARVEPALAIVLVLPELWIAYWNRLCEQYHFNVPVKITAGGATRFHSVQNGLRAIEATQGLVAIHDAVRPFVSEQLINALLDIALEKGNAIPAVAVTDSLRVVSENGNKQLDRTQIRSIQTPQCFNLAIIKEAFEQAYTVAFTDEASVLEAKGHTIILVEGETTNIKITNPQDIAVAEALLAFKKGL